MSKLVDLPLEPWRDLIDWAGALYAQGSSALLTPLARGARG
jgi:hypothetical protein